MTGDASPSMEELLRDPGWVRALARRLVADDVLADDLAQETWLAFLSRPPRSPQALRSWTVSVVRKLAARFRRGEGSRARRELAAARPEASEASPEAALLRVELLEEVLRAVLDPDEP